MSDFIYKGGVLIIGSLLWDPERAEWRQKSFGNDFQAITVRAPIRYGRYSSGERRKCPTMVFSSEFEADRKRGEARIAPFQNQEMSMPYILQAAKDLSKAEGEKDSCFIKGKKSPWCILLFLLNPGLEEAKKGHFIENWRTNYEPCLSEDIRNHFKMESEVAAIFDTNGQLLMEWPKAVDDLDFVLVTQTQPRKTANDRSGYLKPADIATQFLDKPEYFIRNRINGIYTAEDEDIISTLRSFDRKLLYKNAREQNLHEEDINSVPNGYKSTVYQLRALILSQIEVLIKVLGIKQREVENAIQRYDDRVKLIFQNNIEITQQHCLFDWAMGASRGDKHSISFIRFVTDQVSEVLNSIDPRFINTIKKTGKLLVTTFDDNPSLRNNPRFMNYLGEVAGLNYMLQKEKVRFELLAIEKKLPNSKSADFEFLDKSNYDKVLLEFVSLHGIDPTKVESTKKFKQFLEGRFNDKIGTKTKGLVDHHNRIELEDGSKPIFMILPILWNEVEPLLPYRKAFDEINLKYANVLPCVSLLPQLFEDGTVHFGLTAVSNILDRWETMKMKKATGLEDY